MNKSISMRVLIFLPTYNERDNIGKMIDVINDLNFKKEILIVDDNSTDGTLDIINEKCRAFKNITLILRKDRKGRGLAGIVALKYFIKSSFDILVELDADFSHHPKYIPVFLKYFPKYDVIIGSRLVINGGEQRRSVIRYIITLIANLIIRSLFRTKIKDCTSGYRVFKKEILNQFNLENFFSVHSSIVEEILYGCILTKAKIKEVPIIYYERAEGESKLNLKKTLYTFVGILKIIFRGRKILK